MPTVATTATTSPSSGDSLAGLAIASSSPLSTPSPSSPAPSVSLSPSSSSSSSVSSSSSSCSENGLVYRYLTLLASNSPANAQSTARFVVMDPALIEARNLAGPAGHGAHSLLAVSMPLWRESSLRCFLAHRVAPLSGADILFVVPIRADGHWSLLMVKIDKLIATLAASHYDPAGTRRPVGLVEPLATGLARHYIQLKAATGACSPKTIPPLSVAPATIRGSFPRCAQGESALAVCLYARARLMRTARGPGHNCLLFAELRSFRSHALQELERGALIEPPRWPVSAADAPPGAVYAEIVMGSTNGPASVSSGVGSMASESASVPSGEERHNCPQAAVLADALAASGQVKPAARALTDEPPGSLPAPASPGHALEGAMDTATSAETEEPCGDTNELTIEAIIDDRPPLMRRGQRVPAGCVVDDSDYLHYFLARTIDSANNRIEEWFSEPELGGALAILDSYKLSKGYTIATTRPCGATARPTAHLNEANLVELRAVLELVDKLVGEQLRIEQSASIPCRVYTGGQLEATDAVYLVQLGIHCHVLLVSAREQRLYVADGENSSLASATSEALFAQLAGQLGFRLQEVKFHQQRGVDHCGSSAALIACEFIRHHVTRSPMGEFVYALPKMARALARRCHREPSEKLAAARAAVLPPYAAHRCPVPGCGKYFRGASKAPLRMHMHQCHGKAKQANG